MWRGLKCRRVTCHSHASRWHEGTSPPPIGQVVCRLASINVDSPRLPRRVRDPHIGGRDLVGLLGILRFWKSKGLEETPRPSLIGNLQTEIVEARIPWADPSPTPARDEIF
jgi:hypothetical protein